MPGLRKPGPRIAALLAAVLVASPARALEPVSVSVEGVVPVTDESPASLRDQAFQAALAEAVLEVARRFAAPAALEPGPESQISSLTSRAAAFVLTYRVDGAPGRRFSSEAPFVEEFVLALTATVDAAQVREALEELGLLRHEGALPSVVLRVRLVSTGQSGSSGPFGAFERFLVRELEGEGFVVVDPALRAFTTAQVSALELARSLGADVSVDVAIRWTRRQLSERVDGGLAEVRLRALGAAEGSELAVARFEAPAYHEDGTEAFIRALEALQVQLSQNLVLQLQRNWRALHAGDRAISLRMSNVTSFLQVEAVQDALRNVLGATATSISELGPNRAELRVEAPLSAGALQDRLAATVFDGFRLEPVEVQPDRIDVRVAQLTGPAALPAPVSQP